MLHLQNAREKKFEKTLRILQNKITGKSIWLPKKDISWDSTFILFDSVCLNDHDKRVLELTLFYLYFEKTSDKVDIDLLLHKQMKKELVGKFLCLLKSYLETGKQFVEIIQMIV